MLRATLLVGLVAALVAAQAGLAQAGSAKSKPAGPKLSQTASWRLALPQPVRVPFTVPTDAGEVKGTILLTRFDARGLGGYGRFEVRGAFDPASVRTDLGVLDEHIMRWMLRSEEGPITFGATQRFPARPGELPAALLDEAPAATGSSPAAPTATEPAGSAGPAGADPAAAPPAESATEAPKRLLLGAGVYLVQRRSSRYVEVRYRFDPTWSRSRVRFAVDGTMDELGIRPTKHPFIKVTGPMRFLFDLGLVRR